MAATPLRVGVVGTGFGRYHMEGFSKLDGVEVHAICDLNTDEARHFAAQYGARHVFRDYRKMFSMDELDAVSIAVPNYLHAPMAIDALSKGKHVLVEKPMTITPDSAEAMVKAARKAGKRLMVEQALRFLPDTQLVRAYVDQGALGRIYYARSTWYRRRGWPRLHFPPGGTMGRGEWFIRKRLAGYGALGDIGVHLLDLAWYLMGTPRPIAVSGQMWNEVAAPELKRRKMPCEVDELACGMIRFEGGRAIYFEVSWDTHTAPIQECRVMGDKGGATLFPAKLFRGEDIDETVELATHHNGYPVVSAYSHFIDCVRDGRKKMIASGEENVQLIRMLDAVARSARSGKEIRLK